MSRVARVADRKLSTMSCWCGVKRVWPSTSKNKPWACNNGNVGSTDESAQTLTYTITNIPSSITLWKSGGVNAVTSGTTLTLNELQNLQYKTIANAFNSTAQNIT